MATAISSPPPGPLSPGAERSPRFTNAAMAGGRVSSAKHHSISMSETFASKPSSASGQSISGAYPEGHQAPPPVKVGTSQHKQVTHAGHDHRPTLKVDMPTHEQPTGAREGVGSLPGPNVAQGVAVLPDEKPYLHNAPHPPHKKHPQKGAKHKEHKEEPGPQAELPTTEQPSGARVGVGSMPGSNRESGVATLPEERIEGRPYGQGHTGFEELGSGRPTPAPSGEMDSHLATQIERAGGKIAQEEAPHQGETKEEVPINEPPKEIEEVTEVPVFLEGEFERTAEGKYEVVFRPALPAPSDAAAAKQPTGKWTTIPSVARVPPTSVGPQPPEELAEAPQFLEGGYGTTVAGGRYEAVFEPLLPAPGQAATAKEPVGPAAPFAKTTVFLRPREPQAPAEVVGAPHFVEGGFGSTVAGGKYEAEFRPALPAPGEAATAKEPGKPGAPFAKPIVVLRPHAPEEMMEVPHFVEGGFEGTVAGGKYEAEFRPALPRPGEAATDKEPSKPDAPFAQPTLTVETRVVAEPQAPEEVLGAPEFIEGGFGSTVAGGKYEAEFKHALPRPGEPATTKEPSAPSAPFAQPTVTLQPHAPEEMMEAPHFIEGGFENTVAGGKYEAEFRPALPRPGEAATSKEPSKPDAPFAQPTLSVKPHVVPREAPAEVLGAPEFIEGGFGSTVAGGKYEAEFKPALPGPGEAATSKEPMKPSAPFAQPTVTLQPHAPEEMMEAPHFIEGGFENTVAGGKYEAEFRPALPRPGEAATSKEPSKPDAPFAQPTVSVKTRVEPREAPAEVLGAPEFIEGGFGSTVAGGKYEAEFKPGLPSPGEAATTKEPSKPSAPFAQPTVTLQPHAPEEMMEVPHFIEGGFENTVAGGKYEAEFRPALPKPGEAATSKEPTKPSAAFAQTTLLRQPVSACEELKEVPVFVEGGFESTTAGGKYEAVFEPTPPPTTKAEPAPGLPPYLGKPIPKEEEAVQVEQARRIASRKAAGIN